MFNIYNVRILYLLFLYLFFIHCLFFIHLAIYSLIRPTIEQKSDMMMTGEVIKLSTIVQFNLHLLHLHLPETQHTFCYQYQD